MTDKRQQDAIERYDDKHLKDESPEIRKLQEDIRDTRADLTETVDAIQERLSPSHLKEQAKMVLQDVQGAALELIDDMTDSTLRKVDDMFKNTERQLGEAGNSVLHTIKHNPLPTALIGAGLGLLVAGSIRASQSNKHDPYPLQAPDRWDQPEYGYSEAYSRGQLSPSASLKDSVKGRAEDVRDSVKEGVQGMKDSVTGRAQAGGQQLKHGVEKMQHDNPWVLGVAGLFVGAVLGFALPMTGRENEWMGESRDHLIDDVKGAAQEATDKVKDAAKTTFEEAKGTAKEEAKKEGFISGDDQSSKSSQPKM